METNVILKYRRECDSWLCPECDSENNMSLRKCAVCGCIKTSSATILKQWTPADDAPQPEKCAGEAQTGRVPEKRKTDKRIPDGPIFKDTEKEEFLEKEAIRKRKAARKVIIAIVLVMLVLFGIGVGYYSVYAAYSDAMYEFERGNYDEAISMFSKLPGEYKDVSEMINESKYQEALEYLNDGDYETAELKFSGIQFYRDSEAKIKECTYQEAYALFNFGMYNEAKEKFGELGTYSNSAEMVNECTFQTAWEYKNRGEYAEAMKLFNTLGAYSDAEYQFEDADDDLIYYNRQNGYFSNENAMTGRWEDSSGNYVEYVDNGDGSMHTSYNLSYSGGTYFKVSNGVHYHGSDEDGWDRQWIFEQTGYNSANVYDYIDGQVYCLVRGG